jgi:indole-3-glycerol phosphate synthase
LIHPPPTATIPRRSARIRTPRCRFRVNFHPIRDTISGADGISPSTPGLSIVNHSRRLSQAISEGDGISLLVPVDDVEGARSAEEDGAEGIVVARQLEGLRQATGLPILYRPSTSTVPSVGDADACLLRVENGDESGLRELHARAYAVGLEPVIGVRDDEELELALEELDPEILLLAPQDDDEDPLEQVLDLLPDVPAGKLAIAEVQVHTREDVVALERAGVDAVIVGRGDVSRLVGGATPEV